MKGPISFSLLAVGFALNVPMAACGGSTHDVDTALAAKGAASSVARYTGFASPESALYDAENDRYLVANVNGEPEVKDGNGFISVLSPDGKVQNLKWLEGGKNGAQLDAPKGLALANGTLYVADIDVVRLFDAESGKYNGAIPIYGSTFLSAVEAGPRGEIYVTDSGPPRGRWDAKGTEAVYVISGTKATPIARGDTLGRPTGLAWTERGLVVAPFGAEELYRLDDHGGKQDVTKLPSGGLTGLVKLGDYFFVTSFQTGTVLRGKLGGQFEVALRDQPAPGALGFDSKRARLIVPHFTEHSVEVFQLE